ncbi:MAG TPA: O-linked GlcNAc transferase [Pirellulaceae bacterium]|nr:O-linked GlcNAc transferase [Pirellulaceae bacterium]
MTSDDDVAIEDHWQIQALDFQWLSARQVAFVGKLGSVNRRQARQLLRQVGAAMVEANSGRADLIVIGADEMPEDDAGALLDEATIAAAAEGRLEIITETQFWQRLGRVDAEIESRRLYTPAMLAQLLELPLATVRRWHRLGLITPVQQIHKLPYFDFEQVTSAKRLAKWISQGRSPTVIEAKLSRLAEMFPGLQMPLSQLNVMVRGRDVLLKQGAGLVAPGGQLLIDFETLESSETPGDETTVPPIFEFHSMGRAAFNLSSSQASPMDYLRLACELEDAGETLHAIDAYRAMLLAFGPTPEACFRLAELLYATGDLRGARERYFMAVEIDGTFVEARASLGCVLAELGDTNMAILAFEGALQHHPDYPDVHFHLARLLDEMGSNAAAARHWQRFLELVPKSPWSDEARQRLQVAYTEDD